AGVATNARHAIEAVDAVLDASTADRTAPSPTPLLTSRTRPVGSTARVWRGVHRRWVIRPGFAAYQRLRRDVPMPDLWGRFGGAARDWANGAHCGAAVTSALHNRAAQGSGGGDGCPPLSRRPPVRGGANGEQRGAPNGVEWR